MVVDTFYWHTASVLQFFRTNHELSGLRSLSLFESWERSWEHVSKIVISQPLALACNILQLYPQKGSNRTLNRNPSWVLDPFIQGSMQGNYWVCMHTHTQIHIYIYCIYIYIHTYMHIEALWDLTGTIGIHIGCYICQVISRMCGDWHWSILYR